MLHPCSFCDAAAEIRNSRRGLSSLAIACSIAALVVLAALALLYNRHANTPAPTPTPIVVKPAKLALDSAGWDSELARVVRGVYDAAANLDEDQLVKLLDGPRIAQRLGAAKPHAAIDFAALDPAAQQKFLRVIAQELMRGSDGDAAHLWRAFDGRVTQLERLEATVRISADRRHETESSAAVESRTYDWRLARAGENAKWQVWSWQRFISDDERRALEAAGVRKLTKVTLADGTALFQAEMHHIDDYPDTTPELHAQVEKALAKMLDFQLRPPENNQARDALVAIGKAAIPQLLNQFCEVKLSLAADDPSLAQVNMVYDTLVRITGYSSGFAAMPGQSLERRNIALKAYFAWWERKGRNFSEREVGKDLLDDQ